MDTQKLSSMLETKKHFTHISYEEKVSRGLKELQETDPEKIINRWRSSWDNALWGIFWWKIYTIGCETWWWKSTFMNQVVWNIADQWVRVVRYALEDRMEDNAKEDIFYTCNRIRREMWKKSRKWVDFVRNDIKDLDYDNIIWLALERLCKKKNIVELDKKKQVAISDLVNLIEEEAESGARVFVVDHLHYFSFDGKKRLDIEIANVMHNLNEVVRKYNLSMFLVAHYRNQTWEKYWMRPDNWYFKDAAAIKQVSNYIIQIQRDFDEDETNPITKFWFTKKRWPVDVNCIDWEFDLFTYTYKFHDKPQNRDVR